MSRLERLRRYRPAPLQLVHITEAVLVIVLALSLADLAWMLIPLPATDSAASAAAGPGTRFASGPQPAAELNANRPSSSVKALFGMAETVTRIEEEPAGPLQETRLSLTLKGILAQRDGGRKLALIASGDQPEEVYTVGDQVAGAEIIQIEARRVILRRNGVNEALTLEVETLPEGTPGQAGRYDMGGIRRVDDHSVEVPRLTLQRQLSNLPQLLTQAMAVPHRRGGEDLGFRVVSIEEDSILNQLGIRQQDIIRSVNGHSVRTTPEAIQAYENLKASDTFHVNLLRDGREVTIDYTVR